MKRALITGITGQDASYLAEHLLSLGYEVHGTSRRVSGARDRYWRVAGIMDRIQIHYATLESELSLAAVVRKVIPDECYHLSAQSDVPNSFADEFSTMNMNILGTHSLLRALREYSPQCRFYFAASSEMFGMAEENPQTEKTPFHPRSPYAISKVVGFNLARYYRESFGLFACSGILFNHESPRRGEEFVTRKVAKAVARIKANLQDSLSLGTLDTYRDWGYAPDYVRAMHAMLQQEKPDDYVVATGTTHSVREFVEAAFNHAGISKWAEHVKYDPSLIRPADVPLLKGSADKAHRDLAWYPTVTFYDLVRLMVDAELSSALAGPTVTV